MNSTNGIMDGKAIGGDGNDVYRISQSDLMIEEALNEGSDTVCSTVNFTLSSNIEELVLTGKRT